MIYISFPTSKNPSHPKPATPEAHPPRHCRHLEVRKVGPDRGGQWLHLEGVGGRDRHLSGEPQREFGEDVFFVLKNVVKLSLFGYVGQIPWYSSIFQRASNLCLSAGDNHSQKKGTRAKVLTVLTYCHVILCPVF